VVEITDISVRANHNAIADHNAIVAVNYGVVIEKKKIADLQPANKLLGAAYNNACACTNVRSVATLNSVRFTFEKIVKRLETTPN
jgi:hypothetical protein